MYGVQCPICKATDVMSYTAARCASPHRRILPAAAATQRVQESMDPGCNGMSVLCKRRRHPRCWLGFLKLPRLPYVARFKYYLQSCPRQLWSSRSTSMARQAPDYQLRLITRGSTLITSPLRPAKGGALPAPAIPLPGSGMKIYLNSPGITHSQGFAFSILSFRLSTG